MMLHLIFQMVVYRPIVLVLAVRSRFHSTSVSLIHHSWQTTFQCQITMSSACFYYAAFAMQSQQHLYLKFILNQSNSLQMMSFDISCSVTKYHCRPFLSSPVIPLPLAASIFYIDMHYALSKKVLCSCFSGSDKTTVQPLPGREVIDRLASISIARSRIPNSPSPLGELSVGTSSCRSITKPCPLSCTQTWIRSD